MGPKQKCRLVIWRGCVTYVVKNFNVLVSVFLETVHELEISVGGRLVFVKNDIALLVDGQKFSVKVVIPIEKLNDGLGSDNGFQVAIGMVLVAAIGLDNKSRV